MELKWSKLLVANVKPLYMRLSHCVRLSSPLSLLFASAPPETRLSQSPLSLCIMFVYISLSLSRPASLFEQRRRLSHAHALWTAFLADTDAVRGFSSARLGYLPTITFRLLWGSYVAISYLVSRLQVSSKDICSIILECHRFFFYQFRKLKIRSQCIFNSHFKWSVLLCISDLKLRNKELITLSSGKVGRAIEVCRRKLWRIIKTEAFTSLRFFTKINSS